MIILAVLLSWAPVVLDCHGGPEAIDYYRVRGQHVQLVGWTADEPPNPIYTSRAPQLATTSSSSYRFSPEPLDAGDLVWWELEAVDTAGNAEGPCP